MTVVAAYSTSAIQWVFQAVDDICRVDLAHHNSSLARVTQDPEHQSGAAKGVQPSSAPQSH
eukprot:701309-Amphidinium_carterae.1